MVLKPISVGRLPLHFSCCIDGFLPRKNLCLLRKLEGKDKAARKALGSISDGFVSKAVKMAVSWCMLDSVIQNPDWVLFNKQFSFKNLQILLNSSSNIYEQIGNDDTIQ